MKAYASLLAEPISLLTLLCGVAIVLGTDPWQLALAMMVCLSIAGAVVWSVYTVAGPSTWATLAETRREFPQG